MNIWCLSVCVPSTVFGGHKTIYNVSSFLSPLMRLGLHFSPHTGQGISSMTFMLICVFAFFFSLWSLELEILMLLCLAWYLFWGLKPRSSHCGAMLFQLSSPHPSLLFKQECFIYLHGLWLVFYEHLNNL